MTEEQLLISQMQFLISWYFLIEGAHREDALGEAQKVTCQEQNRLLLAMRSSSEFVAYLGFRGRTGMVVHYSFTKSKWQQNGLDAFSGWMEATVLTTLSPPKNFFLLLIFRLLFTPLKAVNNRGREGKQKHTTNTQPK